MDKNITADLIRKSDMSDLRRSMHLDYIFQSTGNSCQWNSKKIALIAYFDDASLLDKCFEYIKEVPKYIDIFITTVSEEIADLIEQKLRLQSECGDIIVEFDDYGGTVGALLMACKDIAMRYEYLGFVYATGKKRDVVYQTVNNSLCDLLWENTAKNGIYIEHVIETFEKEPHLGVLAPPLPYLSVFLKTGFMGWESYYEESMQLIKKLKLNCQISRNKPPFIFDTSFWCRTKALEPLFISKILERDMSENAIGHAIERILPYVAQSQGYYSGIMMTAEYVSLYISNYQYMLNEIADKGNIF